MSSSSLRKINWQLIVAIFLFVFLFCAGIWLSLRKPLWNDEIYTQVQSIEADSYGDMLSGRIFEGNLAPIFYLVQKAICSITHYRFPVQWDESWYFSDLRSQLILRISSNVYMSLTLVMLFYYFSRFHSWKSGFFSLALCLCSLMIWKYWVEARPYSLWVLLSTIQYLILLRMTEDGDGKGKLWTYLTVVHVLLSFSVVVSLVQIVIASFVLWLFKERRFTKYSVLTVVPVAVCLFYYVRSPIVSYRLYKPVELVLVNYAPEWLCVSGLFFIYVTCVRYILPTIKNKTGDNAVQSYSVVAFSSLMLLATVAMFVVIKSREGGPWGQVPARTFIYLSSIAIVTTSYIFAYLQDVFKDRKWMRINVDIVFVGLLIICFLKVYREISLLGLY